MSKENTMIPTDRLILRPAADDALRALLAQQTAEESNFASQRVLAKAGFLPNGQMGEEGPRYTWHGSRE